MSAWAINHTIDSLNQNRPNNRHLLHLQLVAWDAERRSTRLSANPIRTRCDAPAHPGFTFTALIVVQVNP
jgi:hypothetical protein